MANSKLLGILLLLLCKQATGQHLSSVPSIKQKIDSVKKFVFPNPSGDLLPAELKSPAMENEYYGFADSAAVPTFYRGHIFVLTLRNNCTFIYETFYQPYNSARIEFYIGKYKISNDTVSLTYQPLLPGKPDEVYVSPAVSVSWRLPQKPSFLLLDNGRLVEPVEQRLKKGAFYFLTGRSQFEGETCK